MARRHAARFSLARDPKVSKVSPAPAPQAPGMPSLARDMFFSHERAMIAKVHSFGRVCALIVPKVLAEPKRARSARAWF